MGRTKKKGKQGEYDIAPDARRIVSQWQARRIPAGLQWGYKFVGTDLCTDDRNGGRFRYRLGEWPHTSLTIVLECERKIENANRLYI